jgi:hypothetical protein
MPAKSALNVTLSPLEKMEGAVVGNIDVSA